MLASRPALTGGGAGCSIGRTMSGLFRIALFGFSEFERSTMASCLRLSGGYEIVPAGDDCDAIVVDADHGPSLQLALANEPLHRTVFVGSHSPPGAAASLSRPIDAQRVVRALEELLRGPGRVALELVADPYAPVSSPMPLEPEPPHRPTPAPPAWRPLPAADWLAPLQPAAPPRRTPARTAPTALIVDDSAIARRFLASRLLPWGLEVDAVASSGEALRRLAQRHHDFAFVDVELGDDSELDGLSLCRHVKRQLPLAVSQLVLVSAHGSELDQVRGMLAGCDAYLAKPLREDDLARLLARQGLKRGALPRADEG